MRLKLAVALSLFTLLLAAGGTWVLLGAVPALAAGPGMPLDPGIWRWGMLAAAISTGASALAAGYAVAVVGSAAVGALAEKPELFGRLLIFVGLAEGIAIYGLIVAILILNRLG